MQRPKLSNTIYLRTLPLTHNSGETEKPLLSFFSHFLNWIVKGKNAENTIHQNVQAFQVHIHHYGGAMFSHAT